MERNEKEKNDETVRPEGAKVVTSTDAQKEGKEMQNKEMMKQRDQREHKVSYQPTCKWNEKKCKIKR